MAVLALVAHGLRYRRLCDAVQQCAAVLVPATRGKRADVEAAERAQLAARMKGLEAPAQCAAMSAASAAQSAAFAVRSMTIDTEWAGQAAVLLARPHAGSGAN